MALPPPDPKYLFRGDMGCVHCILFRINSNVEHLFAGTAKGNVHIWDLNTNREFYKILSEQNSCLSLLNIDNNFFIQHKCGLIKIYKQAEASWVAHHSINIDFYHYCRFQIFSENEIVVPLKESSIGILSTETLKVELKLNSAFKNLGEVMVIKPLKREKLVLVGYEEGQLILWDTRQRNILSSLMIEFCPMALDFDTNLMKGAIAGPSDNIQIFTLSVNHCLQDKRKITLKNPGTSVVSIRPDNKILAVGGWDGRARIYTWKSLKPLAILNQHKDNVQDISFSTGRIKAYNNKYIMATAAKDGYIALWDIYN